MCKSLKMGSMHFLYCPESKFEDLFHVKASADLCHDLGVLPGPSVIKQGRLRGSTQVLW